MPDVSRLPRSEDGFVAAKWRTAEQGALWLDAAFVRVTVYERRDGWTFSLYHKRRGAVVKPGRGLDPNRKVLWQYPTREEAMAAAFPLWRRLAGRDAL